MKSVRAPSLAIALCVAAASASASCRDAKDGKVLVVDNPAFAKEGPARYAFAPSADGGTQRLSMGTSAKPEHLHFCVDLEVPPPPGANAAIGLYFWKDGDSIYNFAVLDNGAYLVTHQIFQAPYSLVSARPFPDIGKGHARMREVEVEANDFGAAIKVDGKSLTDFVARPPGGELDFGLFIQAKDKSAVMRFANPTVFAK